MKSILVVCEGNICRSPMAQALFSSALPKMLIRSAGLHALSGMPADDTAVRLMLDRGIDISSHRAQQLTRDLCRRADLVFVMSADQRKRVEKDYPFSCGRVYRLGEFLKCDVPDPFRQPESAFRESLRIIEQGVRDWSPRIDRIQVTTT